MVGYHIIYCISEVKTQQDQNHKDTKHWTCLCPQIFSSSLRRTAGSQVDGGTCPLTRVTWILSSCSSLPLLTTGSGSLPSTRWAKVSPAFHHRSTRPAELVRYNLCVWLWSRPNLMKHVPQQTEPTGLNQQWTSGFRDVLELKLFVLKQLQMLFPEVFEDGAPWRAIWKSPGR